MITILYVLCIIFYLLIFDVSLFTVVEVHYINIQKISNTLNLLVKFEDVVIVWVVICDKDIEVLVVSTLHHKLIMTVTFNTLLYTY